MTKPEKYILDEVEVIEKECLEKDISPIEWIERYAERYCRKYINGSIPKIGMLKNRRG